MVLHIFLDVYLSETRSRKSVGHRFWAFLRLGRHPDSEGTTKGTNPSLRRNLVKCVERSSILKNDMLVLVTIKEKVLDDISNQCSQCDFASSFAVNLKARLKKAQRHIQEKNSFNTFYLKFVW